VTLEVMNHLENAISARLVNIPMSMAVPLARTASWASIRSTVPQLAQTVVWASTMIRQDKKPAPTVLPGNSVMQLVVSVGLTA
tara:strand:+ start:4695 stop:4943 length:249 start_codon:yes stop_codon:yes gene_type:complete